MAQEIVRFVRATGGRFGKTVVADALHGANNERVRQFRLDAAPGYAALAEEPLGRIKDVIDQLVGRGYLQQAQGRFPTLGLGPRAVEALVDPCEDPAATPFAFTVKRRAAKRKTGSARALKAVDLLRDEAALDDKPRVGDDAELFERLRTVRTDFARERQLPPYMICSDKTLRGMCRRRPATHEELLEVPGIGERKATEFGAAFLAEIAAFEREQ